MIGFWCFLLPGNTKARILLFRPVCFYKNKQGGIPSKDYTESIPASRATGVADGGILSVSDLSQNSVVSTLYAAFSIFFIKNQTSYPLCHFVTPPLTIRGGMIGGCNTFPDYKERWESDGRSPYHREAGEGQKRKGDRVL